MPDSPINLTRYARLSALTAVLILGLKLGAWMLTGSVGLLSDALETLTNVGGALMALLMLRLAAQPPDEEHAYGHSKAEYFSSGFEGMLIFLAAAVIMIEAVPRLLAPQPLQRPGVGLAVAAVAAVLNFAVARLLERAGDRHHSITLQADARHLMADVWTTAGVIVGVGLVMLTGWLWLDPLVALLVALNVLWEGFKLVRESATGLMDAAWPEQDRLTLLQVLEEFRSQGADFHALRTRRSAAQRFVDFHVLVPGGWTVQRGHDLLEQIERRLAERLPNVTVLTHLEPAEDPLSYEGEGLDRVCPRDHGDIF
ncbi:MAG: cation diffusion facilitator family transporter [Nevskia sp.]|nr:cation diffusion facilitator family transporter [Nevskia sp.]